MRFHRGAVLLAAAALFGAAGAHAAQSYDNCTGFITSLPALVTTQGTWCLKQDLTTAISNGNAITIAANNVTLDCNDFKIGGLTAGSATLAEGIFAQDRFNAIIRHCNIRGFYRGIHISGSSAGGHVVEDNRFNDNTYIGIEVDGEGSMIRRNQVFDTSGSTAIDSRYGIYALYSVDILDNTVFGVFAANGGNGHAVGIFTFDNISGSINGNRIRGLIKSGTGLTVGIDNNLSDHVSMRDNDISGDATAGSIGLRCADADSSARDNSIRRFASAFSVCNDDGGNVVRP